MKAVALTQYLPVENSNAFIDVELTKATANSHDLLVSVKSVSVNLVDTKVHSPKIQVKMRLACSTGMPVVLSVPSEFNLPKPLELL